MHEVSICQALITQVEKIAVDNQAQKVASISVQIGLLSGVVPELLDHAFQILKENSVVEEAILNMTVQATYIYCPQCDAEMAVPPDNLTCPQCGDWHTTLISGDEMLLLSVELLTA